jgi:UDP-perosamine 4-acetyltransferase
LKDKVVIVGDGGHAKVILDILESSGLVEIVGFTGMETPPSNTLLGYPFLGCDTLLPQLFESGVHHAFVALGDNGRRQRRSRSILEQGFTLINAISTAAVISRHACVGAGVAVMPGAIVNAGTHIGDGAIVNTNASIDHDCDIGNFAHVGPGAVLAGSVSVGDEAMLGAGCRLIPGIKVGRGAVVGAGAVVIRDLPDYAVAVGVPATLIKKQAG